MYPPKCRPQGTYSKLQCITGTLEMKFQISASFLLTSVNKTVSALKDFMYTENQRSTSFHSLEG